ncbi:MAG: septal ring lytic transglycosylase RlpA family protein [Bryobacterales bacterium]|nr:septal ring lytic transglycosylase RlpA family protein [Bryobacterales bacterium]
MRLRFPLSLLPLVAFVAASGCGARKPVKAVTPKIGQQQRGIASWYGYPYHGRRAASGEIYDMERFTAAHRNWAFNTWVRVYNLDNGRVTDVRITDRGPFVRGRIIDLSRAAARSVNMIGPGIARVRLEVIPPPPQPPASAPPSPTATQRFTVQIASFADRARAEAFYQSLQTRYSDARLSLSPSGRWRIFVGVFPSTTEADAFRRSFSAEFPDAFVLRLDDIT